MAAQEADLPSPPDLVAIDRAVTARWNADRVAARSLARSRSGQEWICLESTPAASGMPGINHVPAAAMRDLYQRMRTMQGYHVPRLRSWDGHGLAVEVAVEKELGLSGPGDIESYGVEQFGARCKESALRHADAHAALTTRLGDWAGQSGARRTLDSGSIEAVWSSLHQAFEDGLLVRDERIALYCPRCRTPVGEGELSQQAVRKRVMARSVIVRFPLRTLPGQVSPLLHGADLLASTARPWTLVANAAVAVHPHLRYALARRAGHDDRVIVAEAAAGLVLGEEWHVAARVSGAELIGACYTPPLARPGMAVRAGGNFVVPGYFVTAETGTGLAHIAPAFGTDDLKIARASGLPVVDPIGPDGRFNPDIPLVGGVFFADADQILAAALADRGLLFAARNSRRSHPHCWRCGTPLLTRALRAWYLRTAGIAGRPAESEAANRAAVDGRPTGSIDWGLSRTRYWGTPLPLWECEHGHVTCAASLRHLSELAGRDLSGLDPHRPAIDMVTIVCPRCGAPGQRVPDVVDSDYDAAAMLLTASGPPSVPASSAAQRHVVHFAPAAADGEAGDWLNSVETITGLVSGHPPAGTAIRLGKVLDDRGRQMSSRAGNLADPLVLAGRYGADALRWLCTATVPPQAARRVSDAALADVVSSVLLRYWNAAAFYVKYRSAAMARDDSWQARVRQVPPAARPALDRWILGELHALTAGVTSAFESLRTDVAGRRIRAFIDDLSRWYLRRSRRRFGDSASTDAAAAFATLHECLDVLTRLMAPIVPFVTDFVWWSIRMSDAPDSVHLASWPVPGEVSWDERLVRQMAAVRRVGRLGRSARATVMIPLRQPLAHAVVAAQDLASLDAEMLALLADELNAAQVELTDIGDPAAVQGWTECWPPPAWAVALADREAVALDVTITPELRRTGLARAAIRTIQNARRTDGLSIGDEIALRWSATHAGLAQAMTEHAPLISSTVHAPDYDEGRAGTGLDPECSEHTNERLGLTCWIRPLAACG